MNKNLELKGQLSPSQIDQIKSIMIDVLTKKVHEGSREYIETCLSMTRSGALVGNEEAIEVLDRVEAVLQEKH